MDRNLAAVITAGTCGLIAFALGLAVPCLGFASLINPGQWWMHINTVLLVLVITPIILIPLALVLLNFPKRRRPPADQVCRTCGYDVRGQPSEGRCPECGSAI